MTTMIPPIMPRTRITAATSSIQDTPRSARRFDAGFPGVEIGIHGLRFEPGTSGRRCLVD
jgi:arginine decarboxylase